MILKLHQFSNGLIVLIPDHNITSIQEHKDGGSAIYTNIETPDPKRTKTFHSRETIDELNFIKTRNE